MDDIVKTISQISEMAKAHLWVPLASVVIGLLIRLVKDDALVAKFPITVPPKWRAWLALGLGVVSGVIQAVMGGADWATSIIGGLISAIMAISGHELVIEGLRNGRDLGVPKENPK